MARPLRQRHAWGAVAPGDSTQSRIDAVVDAGTAPDSEGYSGFEDTDLEQLLREHDVSEVHVAGLALDYCVKATALDARRAGFDVVLHRDCHASRRRPGRRRRSGARRAAGRRGPDRRLTDRLGPSRLDELDAVLEA